MTESLLVTVRQFLQSQSTLTLATVGPGGLPAAADLYFVADSELFIYFVSEPDARHAQNIASHAGVAVTVHAPAWDWRDIRGVQLEGTCQPLTSVSERMAALALYGRKFDFISAFAAAITRHTVFRFTPRWLRWLDNRVEFGHKEEAMLGKVAGILHAAG